MNYELIIIGAGLTGIEVALQAYAKGLENVLIVDYNNRFGGFSSLFFNEDEFENEKKLVEKFHALPYDKWTKATVTGLFEAFDGGNHEINIQTSTVSVVVEAKKIVISTGALEQPREAHKIGGTRPSGVITPMMAVGLLERGFLPGEKIVLFENSKISRFLSSYLLKKGADVIQIQAKDYLVHMIYGKSRLEKIDIKNKQNDQIESFECDTLIFSEGFIPSTFFLKGTGVNLNNKNFILTDTFGKTSVENIFAFGYCTDYFNVSSKQIEKSLETII